MNDLISIVFLNYNRLDETHYTVQKLLECRDMDADIEIISVDNGSTDGTAEYLMSEEGNIKVILLDKNYGIGGYNRGFGAARGKMIIVLDDDSHVESDTIQRVRRLFALNGDIGIVAFKILDNDRRRVSTWHIPAEDRYQESFAFVGCGFAARKDVFEQAGFYPESFFVYHNEIAVAVEVRRLGWKVVYDPQCVAVHRTQGQQRDAARRTYYTLRNSLILIWTYYPLAIALYMTISRLMISLTLAFWHGKLNAFAKALVDFKKTAIKRKPLAPDEIKILTPFFIQNSIIHRLADSLKNMCLFPKT